VESIVPRSCCNSRALFTSCMKRTGMMACSLTNLDIASPTSSLRDPLLRERSEFCSPCKAGARWVLGTACSVVGSIPFRFSPRFICNMPTKSSTPPLDLGQLVGWEPFAVRSTAATTVTKKGLCLIAARHTGKKAASIWLQSSPREV